VALIENLEDAMKNVLAVAAAALLATAMSVGTSFARHPGPQPEEALCEQLPESPLCDYFDEG